MPGITGSVLHLVGMVSAYNDWIRHSALSATSVSMWQHVTFSKQGGFSEPIDLLLRHGAVKKQRTR